MAKKGQKFKHHTVEFKAEIMRKHLEENVPASTLEREYGVSRKTIHNWVHKQKKGIDIFTDHRQFGTGRPRNDDTNVDYKERYEILKKYQAFLRAQREKK